MHMPSIGFAIVGSVKPTANPWIDNLAQGFVKASLIGSVRALQELCKYERGNIVNKNSEIQ